MSDCVITSVVGETIAAKTKDMTMSIFRFDRKNSPDTRPSFARKMTTRGNSKINPKGRVRAMMKDKYASKENIGCNVCVAKPIKKPTAAGTTK